MLWKVIQEDYLPLTDSLSPLSNSIQFSATLLASEHIPHHLLPPSPSSSGPIHPTLRRIVSEHHSSLTIDTVQLAFELSVGADGVANFVVDAIPQEGEKANFSNGTKSPVLNQDVTHDEKHRHQKHKHKHGGLKYLVQFRFGVLPSRDKPSLIPSDMSAMGSVGDRDNMYLSAPHTLVGGMEGEGGGTGGDSERDGEVEVVKVEVPVIVRAAKVTGIGSSSVFHM